MLYAINHRFRVGSSAVVQGGSLLQNRSNAITQRNMAQSSIFEVGTEYEVYYLKKIMVEGKSQFEYTFRNMNTRALIKHTWSSITEAEEYISKASGQLQVYQDTLKKIQATYASDS